MCQCVEFFHTSSFRIKWLLTLFAITGVYSFIYWFIIIPLLFEDLKTRETEHWLEHWSVLYFAVALLIWSLLMFIIVGIWYLCRNRALRNVEEPVKDALVNSEDHARVKNVNDKVRCTLGLDSDFSEIRKEVLLRKSVCLEKRSGEGKLKTIPENGSDVKVKKNKQVSDLEIDDAVITPLPEYSPEAKSTIFDFNEESRHSEERSRSPFQEYLHLVQIESPDSPEAECLNYLNASIEERKGTSPDKSVSDISSLSGTELEDVVITDSAEGTDEQLQRLKEEIKVEAKRNGSEEEDDNVFEDLLERQPAIDSSRELMEEIKEPEQNIDVFEHDNISFSDDEAIIFGPTNDITNCFIEELNGSQEDIETESDRQSINLSVEDINIIDASEVERPTRHISAASQEGIEMPQEQKFLAAVDQDYQGFDNEENVMQQNISSSDEESATVQKTISSSDEEAAAIQDHHGPDDEDVVQKNISSSDEEEVVDQEYQEDNEGNSGSASVGSNEEAELVDHSKVFSGPIHMREPCQEESEISDREQLAVVEQEELSDAEADASKKRPQKLTRKESSMFLGNIGRSDSVLTELYAEVARGTVVEDSVALMGRHQVLKDPIR